ncbi:excitatory amino acid transporter 3-like isoform X1 [Mytilus trossulus]|uniref:excitatory amino acid transporter 3-like isoform X1 n=2 Tax=Mytilus trossulus TaxID=6551 RepID=UPI003003AA0A
MATYTEVSTVITMENEPEQKVPNRKGRVKKIILDNLLIILMIIAVAIGIGLGIGLREIWSPNEKRKLHYLRFPGDLLMNMLKMLILPLIISSLVSSLAFLDAKASGRMGLRAVVYYMLTTLFAVILGIIMVLAISPGTKGSTIDKSGAAKKSEPLDALFDLIRNCFPDNLIEACFKRQQTDIEKLEVNETYINKTSVNHTEYTVTKTVDNPKVNKADGMNILGLVVFSIFFGCTLSKMGKTGKPLADFFECMHLATMKLVTLVIWFSPIGIIFLIAVKLIEMENLSTVFTQLGYYMATVLSGLALHAIITLPLIYFIGVRKNPFIYMFNMLKALLTAWGTASSSATLPVTMECLEVNNKIDERVIKFVTPIGATINMDGTALYEAVAAIFIAQHLGITLSIGEVIVVSLTATAAAIGAAGIPQAGLVTMAIVLTAVGLPIDEITLILPIDWFLDRFRTAINVLGDAYGAGLVAHMSKADLEEMDRREAKENGNGLHIMNGDIDSPQVLTKL